MSLSNIVTKSVVDCHVHLAALPDQQNGCLISPRMLKSPLFRFLLWKHDLPLRDPRQANQKYLDDLLVELCSSRYVGKAVLLGMDGVYDQHGRLDHQHTDFLVSKDYVLHAYPTELLAGVSINPRVESGAALVKVLPNSQRFDPANHNYKAFYRAIAQHKIPLLSHVEHEFIV